MGPHFYSFFINFVCIIKAIMTDHRELIKKI